MSLLLNPPKVNYISIILLLSFSELHVMISSGVLAFPSCTWILLECMHTGSEADLFFFLYASTEQVDLIILQNVLTRFL